jgi:hypothetical protein
MTCTQQLNITNEWSVSATHRTSSSTPNSLCHFSRARIISFAFGTLNLRGGICVQSELRRRSKGEKRVIVVPERRGCDSVIGPAIGKDAVDEQARWRGSTRGRRAGADRKRVTGTKGIEGGLGLGSEDPALSFQCPENCAPVAGDTLPRVPAQKNQAGGGGER